MRVLVDTDVLIDVALGREPWAEAAGQLLDRLEQRPGTGFIAWHSISSFHYLIAPMRGRSGAKEFLLELARFIEVAPASTDALRVAGSLELADFEDALQVAAGLEARAEVIATRNLEDYARSPLPAYPPERVTELLEAS